VRKRNSDSFVRVPTEPDFFILFLNFIAIAKSKNLAVNGNAIHERLETLFALHIGVVTKSCIVGETFVNQTTINFLVITLWSMNTLSK